VPRWGGDLKEGGPGNWVSNTFWGRLQPYAFGDVGAVNQKTRAKGINRRLDQLFNSTDAYKMEGVFINSARSYHDTSGLPIPIAFISLLWIVVTLFTLDRGVMAANCSTMAAASRMQWSDSKNPNMIEVPPAPIPWETVAVFQDAGICEGGFVQPASRP
jgi:hypothetical protein